MTIFDQVHQRQWFYRFDLPDGSHTESYLPTQAQPIHDTRLKLLKQALEPTFNNNWHNTQAIDLACHQGWFMSWLAKQGCQKVLGVDIREQHIDDARLITQAQNFNNVDFLQSDLYNLQPSELGQFDIVLMLGLLYHVENPIGALRMAKNLCKGWCIIETQLGPHLSGPLDWGSYEFTRPIQGAFSVIDEVDETHAPEASAEGYGICMAPSLELLLWLLKRIGFNEVKYIEPSADDYEQHKHRKRCVVAAKV